MVLKVVSRQKYCDFANGRGERRDEPCYNKNPARFRREAACQSVPGLSNRPEGWVRSGEIRCSAKLLLEPDAVVTITHRESKGRQRGSTGQRGRNAQLFTDDFQRLRLVFQE